MFSNNVEVTMDDFLAKGTKEKKSEECSKCGKVFKKIGAHKLHCKGEEHRCPMCGEELEDKVGLITHLTARHNAVYRGSKFHCAECSWTGSMVRTWANHVAQHKAKELECPHCLRVFPSVKEMERHVRLHERGAKAEETCPICKEVLFSLDGHMWMKHGIRKPQQQHKQKKNLQCPQCPKMLRNRGDLERHFKYHEKGMKTETCPICQEVSFNLDGHMGKKHGGANKRKRMSKLKLATTHTCPHCDLVFKSSSSLKRHINQNHKDKQADHEEEVGCSGQDPLDLNGFPGDEEQGDVPSLPSGCTTVKGKETQLDDMSAIIKEEESIE